MRNLLPELTDERTRWLAGALGLSLMAFGIVPAVAPRPFAWLFGLERPTPETASMIRSIGVRDAVMGAGLWSAATHGGKYAPWLLARILSDGGDTVAVSIAAAQGQRRPRFLALGGLALAATAADAALWALARRA
ncbi:MAG TPA: DUF4267 domain-containing protein [Ktedonobacterales bacterium]